MNTRLGFLQGAAALALTGRSYGNHAKATTATIEDAQTPGFPAIAVVNSSSIVTVDELGYAIAAAQYQVDQHFQPVWGRGCSLYVGPARHASHWRISIEDFSPEAGALGWHELTAGGRPLARIFAAASAQANVAWTSVLSHELVEMLADPQAGLCLQVDKEPTFYAIETADPVQASSYFIQGIEVSNFVHPSWFLPTVKHGRYDHLGRVRRPLEILSGGYQIIFRDNRWSAIPSGPLAGPRRVRRAV